jgi:hypothetical protein
VAGGGSVLRGYGWSRHISEKGVWRNLARGVGGHKTTCRGVILLESREGFSDS